MTKLTELEFKLMENIAHCEMGPLNTGTPQCADDANTFLWLDDRAECLEISEKAAGGVLTSLQNKKLIGVVAPNCKMTEANRNGMRGRKDPDGAVWFTEEGFQVWLAERTERGLSAE